MSGYSYGEPVDVPDGFEGVLFPVRYVGGPRDGEHDMFIDVPLNIEAIYPDGDLICRVAYHRSHRTDPDGCTRYLFNEHRATDVMAVLYPDEEGAQS